MMLSEICADLRNYFVAEIHEGTFEVASGNISPLDFLQDGQYFRIVGSVFNDGVWQYPNAVLHDERFEGAIWAMRVPPSLIALSAEIEEWVKKYGEADNSPFQSESVGEYSYTKKQQSDGASGGWRSAFAKRLNVYRKI